jgi:hypothetical protein
MSDESAHSSLLIAHCLWLIALCHNPSLLDNSWLSQDKRILCKPRYGHTSTLKTNELKAAETLLWEVPCGVPSAIEFRFLQHAGGLGHL